MDSNHESVHLAHSDSFKKSVTPHGSLKDVKIPLLGDILRHPNCPGCRNGHLTAKGAKVPFTKLVMVSSVVLCNALPISSLYPFIYFMVEDFQIANSSDDIGYYAGAVGSVFMFGRVLSSVPWGYFADKYGRRSVFVFGLVSIIVFQPIFGVSTNFWVAFAARFLLGLFNGMLGPLKAYASEICNTENQAWGLTAVSTSWSLGLIVGPALGGFLARPAINFPSIFGQNSFFGRYPYLLPSLVQAAFAAVELVVVYYLPETIHIHDSTDGDDIEENISEEGVDHIEGSLWTFWPLIASVAVYCVWSLHEISFTEVFSLWCVSPTETGGLSLSTSDVGVILAISGFGMLCIQLALFPPLATLFGPTLVTRIPAIIAVPIVLLFPFVSNFSGTIMWLTVNGLALVRNILSAMVVTGSFLMVNNAVPTVDRGAANGISLAAVSVFRTIGPAAAGALFAWGQSRHDTSFLPGSQMIFAIMAFLCVLSIFTMVPPFLPPQVDIPYAEWLEEQKKAKSGGLLADAEDRDEDEA